METTTTTPGRTFCFHDQFESKVEVKKHDQTTDGITETSYAAVLEVRCKQCGVQMTFPCPQGHNHLSTTVSMTPRKEGMAVMP